MPDGGRVLGSEFWLRTEALFAMDGRTPVGPGAVLVRDGRIADVILGRSTPRTDRPKLDVGALPVLPGFVDPHVHLEMAATAMYGAVDCHTPPCGSVDEVLAALRSQAELRHLRGGWLVGQGNLFAGRRFVDQRLPNRHDLDKVSSDFPIAIRFGGHVTVVNTRGLELGLQAGLPETGDSEICRDEAGELTGELHELFYALPVPALSPDEMTDAVVTMTRDHLTRFGVTRIGEITNTVEGIRLIGELAGTPRLPLSVDAFMWAPGTKSFDAVFHPGLRQQFPAGPDFRVRGVKIFVDGGYSAGGAAVLRPYRQSGTLGRLAFDRADLAELVRRADERELQVAAHVNGERAQRLLCDAVVDARGLDPGGLPVRLEHAGNVLTDRRTVDYWARAAAVPVAQAGFIWSMSSFIVESLGAESRQAMFPFRDLTDLQVTSSSDGAGSELRQFNPLFGVQCAVTRTSCIGEVIAEEQTIDVETALSMHTAWAAGAVGMADEVGSIRRGLRADLVVLDTDPRKAEPARLGEIAAALVFRGGKLVYDNTAKGNRR
jgi:predicted amidohydrolase YtcJ